MLEHPVVIKYNIAFRSFEAWENHALYNKDKLDFSKIKTWEFLTSFALQAFLTILKIKIKKAEKSNFFGKK